MPGSERATLDRLRRDEAVLDEAVAAATRQAEAKLLAARAEAGALFARGRSAVAAEVAALRETAAARTREALAEGARRAAERMDALRAAADRNEAAAVQLVLRELLP